jgi:hypothetical protein
MSDSLETAIAAGCARALRRRAAAQRRRAGAGTVHVDGQAASVVLRSPEAAHAARVAADWDSIANFLEAEARL